MNVLDWLLTLACAAAAAYQCIAIAAAIRFLLRRDPPFPASATSPRVAILKPVRGLDEGFAPAARSHSAIDYADYEVLFGAADENDPALAEARRVHSPRFRFIHSRSTAPNGKVAVLRDLREQAAAGAEILVVNDSDILVPPDYLQRTLAPLLADPRIGLVTCAYRASSPHWPGRWEALGIATDFAPSVLVAPLFGVNEFGMGSTLVFRAATLERIGGFDAIAPYIADDYQIGKRIAALGFRVHLSRLIVDTHLDGREWGEVWRHQVRWAKTIRASRGGGYAGLPVTNASLWALLAIAVGGPLAAPAGWALLLIRLLMAWIAGVLVLDCPIARRYFWLSPLRDLWGFGIWLAGFGGGDVAWRDRLLRLDREGRITEVRTTGR